MITGNYVPHCDSGVSIRRYWIPAFFYSGLNSILRTGRNKKYGPHKYTFLRRPLWNTQCLNVSTTPITAMGCRQCLPLSVVQLKGKHCRKPHCRNGVVDSFGQGHLKEKVLLLFILLNLCDPSLWGRIKQYLKRSLWICFKPVPSGLSDCGVGLGATCSVILIIFWQTCLLVHKVMKFVMI